jgi:hypothetical protein
MKGKNYKKYSSLVEIRSTLTQLRAALIRKGRVLQELLEVEYPGADAVCSAIGEIQNLLDHDGLCDVWVSAHVKVDDMKKFISNSDVRKVRVLFIAILDCAEHACAQSIFISLLR